MLTLPPRPSGRQPRKWMGCWGRGCREKDSRGWYAAVSAPEFDSNPGKNGMGQIWVTRQKRGKRGTGRASSPAGSWLRKSGKNPQKVGSKPERRERACKRTVQAQRDFLRGGAATRTVKAHFAQKNAANHKGSPRRGRGGHFRCLPLTQSLCGENEKINFFILTSPSIPNS